MEKITKSAVELRLNPAHWPAELSRKELSAPFEMNKAIEAANDVFVRFQEAHQIHATSGNLTPAGIRAADAEWAAENLPALRDRLIKLRKTAWKAETSMIAQLTADLRVPATEPHDILMMQEIRTWLRSLLEAERLKQIRKLSGQGDKSVLRAMLTVPSYLTGVDEELLVALRDDAARRAYPERHAKMEAFRKAANVADRAVEGVIRYVEQETAFGSAAAASRSAA